MLEQIYKTLQAILFLELPVNSKGNIVVYDREIKGWNLGDRKLKPATPSITFQSNSTTPKEISTNTYEVEHQISIKLETANDSQDITETIVVEMTRLLYEALLPHRQIWITTKCPICLKNILTPLHFTDEHPAIFNTYADIAIANELAMWNLTHIDTMPPLKPSRIATDAFRQVLEAVKNNEPVANLPASAVKVFEAIINNKMRPVRLLYDVHVSSIKPSDGGINKETFHIGEFTLTAKEIIKIPAIGPDNVPSKAWSAK